MKKIVKELLDTSIYLLVVLVLTYLVITFVGQRTQVSGSSMETTLSDEDNLIVDKISYRFSEPKRFDIIVFPFEYEEDTYYIKRIIGMPGERVQIDGEGNIYGIAGTGLGRDHTGRRRILCAGGQSEPQFGQQRSQCGQY